MSDRVSCFRFCAENPKVELLEVSGESRGQSGPVLADGRAHGEHPRRGHSAGARDHPETGGAMMELVDTSTGHISCVMSVFPVALTAEE